ncbi:MAG: nicotinate (nicotinamide) nucleotide adenylyltransferase, partial [Bacteroidota bacterium]
SAVNETDLDAVRMVVSPHNPHKPAGSLLPEQHRFEMVRRALEANPDISASDVEFALPKPSYTIDTLNHRELRSQEPDAQFTVIMGEDNLDHLHKWKAYETLLAEYEILCYPRLSSAGGFFEQYPMIKRFEMPYLDLSATRIRHMRKIGKSVRYMVPAGAFDYLQTHNLYAE